MATELLLSGPCADLIADHREWMEAGAFSKRSIDDACELLDRVDRHLAAVHMEREGVPLGLAGAYPEELTAWLAQRHCPPGYRQWSAQTRATYRQHLRRFYAWANDSDDPRLTYDPSVRLRRPKVNKSVPSPTPQAQVEQILARARQPWWLHCLLAAKVGMRPIEIAAARRSDFTATHVRIPHGKGDKPATLPLDGEVWEAVRDLPPGPITRKLGGGPANANWVSNLTAAHLRRIGVPTSLRYLRHWYATWLLDHGVTLREVQELMRHESVATTQGYTAVTEARLRAAILTLPRFGVAAGGGGGGRSGVAA